VELGLRQSLGTFLSRIGVPVFAAALLVAPGEALAARTLTVCPSGPPTCQFASIQDALDASSDGDRIEVAAGSYNGGVTIRTSVGLVGAGTGQTTIDAGSPVVTVAADTSVTIRGVTITGGVWSSVRGAGIHNEGTLTVEETAVRENIADGAGGVGGIYSSGRLALDGTTISGNRGGFPGVGGVSNDGTATITRSTISGNISQEQGGGISNHGTAAITDSTISGNFGYLGGGGGIANFGTLAVTRSAIDGNHGGDGSGGGIYNWGTAIVTATTVSGNFGEDGGGIANLGTLTLSRSPVRDNEACCIFGTGAGGGIWNWGTALLVQSPIDGNAAVSGGGIANFGTLTVRHSDLIDNSTSNLHHRTGDGGGLYNGAAAELFGATIRGNVATGRGGGIRNGPGYFGGVGTLRLEQSAVTGNTALDLDGTGIFGGGIYTDVGTVTLWHTSVSGNTPDDCVGC
jgi:hypothetical protein